MSRGAEKSRRHLSLLQQAKKTCTLCLKPHRQLSTLANWKSGEARSLAISLKVCPDALVCAACRKDITRMISNDAYVPRWEKERHRKNMCCTAQCPKIAMASLHKASSEKLVCLRNSGLSVFHSRNTNTYSLSFNLQFGTTNSDPLCNLGYISETFQPKSMPTT